MLRLIVLHREIVQELELPTTAGVLGSASSSALTLPFAGVSRRHARFEPVPGGLRLIDLESKNGLVVEGRRVSEVVLRPGGSVRIGHAELRLAEVSPSDLELALPLGELQRSTDVVEGNDLRPTIGADEASARRGVLLIRDLEAMPLRELEAHHFGVLERARGILGAEMLALFDLADRARPAVQAIAGPLGDADLDTLLANRPPALRSGPSIQSVACERWLICTVTGSPAALVARCATNVDAESAWRQALGEYLLTRLGGGSREVAAGRVRPVVAELRPPEGMVFGPSNAGIELLRQVRSASLSHADVLLLGATGTGKELVAHLIHASSPKARGPFRPVSCPTLPSELLEAELFGVTDRAATGVAARPGHFVSAHGGTLLLDEIGDLPLGLQAKLLRVLQEREVWPLGASRARKVDVRVIAATHRDLPAMVREGAFRADLFYRLRQLEIRIPTLRERKEDIPALVLHFVRRFAAQHRKPLRGVSRHALDRLVSHDWPGNIRDLEAEILRAVVACPPGDLLQSVHLGLPEPAVADLQSSAATREPPSPSAASVESRAAEHTERHTEIDRVAIREALDTTRGNKAAAARLLGISREGLRKKMLRLGLS